MVTFKSRIYFRQLGFSNQTFEDFLQHHLDNTIIFPTFATLKGGVYI
ncbi:hypothetical protein SAMN06295967_108152 [Belliella buryatensis]|uniref:Uncharacterized protein n=1 Tax=Belliella buryatensis TaxID=1500549 RepID=A0A239E456_9BACT|nr:hypothetical protein SAMN06295967_108152 [Belliella buryatensis]